MEFDRGVVWGTLWAASEPRAPLTSQLGRSDAKGEGVLKPS